MGDFVDKGQVDQIREHYQSYQHSPNAKYDNRAAPLLSGVYDATTFRECSTWYVNRLLRYIEVEDFLKVDCDGGVTKLQHKCGGCGFDWPERSAYDELVRQSRLLALYERTRLEEMYAQNAQAPYSAFQQIEKVRAEVMEELKGMEVTPEEWDL